MPPKGRRTRGEETGAEGDRASYAPKVLGRKSGRENSQVKRNVSRRSNGHDVADVPLLARASVEKPDRGRKSSVKTPATNKVNSNSEDVKLVADGQDAKLAADGQDPDAAAQVAVAPSAGAMRESRWPARNAENARFSIAVEPSSSCSLRASDFTICTEAPSQTSKATPIKKAPLFKMLSLADAPELAVLLVGVIGALGNGILQPTVILLWGDMIDGLAVPGSSDASAHASAMDKMMDDIADKALLMVLWGGVATFAGTIQGCCFPRFAEHMKLKMLHQYYYAVIHSDVEWFDAQDPASMPLQMTSDAQIFGEAWGVKLGTSVMGVSTFIGGYVLAFSRGWPIALVMAGCLPFMAVGTVVMGAAMQAVQLETQGWYAKAAAIVEDTLYAIRTVVAFGGEPREIERYSAAVSKARFGGVKNNFKIGVGLGYTMAVCFLSYGLAFYVGMRFSYDNVVNPSTDQPWKPGEIMGVFMCVLMASFMVGTVDPGVKAFQAAQVSVARFFDARDTPPRIQCRGEDIRQQIDTIQKFEFRDVHFAYPSRRDVKVLNGLSFAVQQGQKVAVVGESGSGKSTVMSLLERFYDAQEGYVLVNGQSIKLFSIAALRACIGYVGQEPVLFATSIRQNILQCAPGAMSQALEKAIADAQLDFVSDLPEELDTYVGAGGLQLSGGQKQRIAIARALIKQAGVLFLDEATSALDNASEKMIQETIDNLTSVAHSLTIITIAHRLSTVRAADVIYVLSEGTLAESGTHADLMAKEGIYHALVAAQDGTSENGDNLMSATASNAQGDDPTKTVKNQSKARAVSMVAKEAVVDKDQEKEQEERKQKVLKEYKVSMSRLLGFCRPEWPYFFPAILAALFDGGSQPLTGVLIVEAMYGFMKPAEEMKDQLERVSWYFTCVALGELVAVIVSSTCFGMLGESLTMRLRTAIYSAIFQQEMGFHDDPDNSPGSLSAQLEVNAFRVSNLCKAIGHKAAAFSSLLIGLTFSFIASWRMSLVLLGSIPINIAAQALQMVVMLGGSANSNETVKQAQQLASESVQNIRTVHACGCERPLTALYRAKIMASQVSVIRHLLAGFAFGVSGGVMFFIMAGSFYVMGMLIKEGHNDFREVMIAFMGTFFAAMGAGQAASMMGDASQATVAAHDAFQLLDRPSKINGMHELCPAPEGDVQAGCVEFQDVHFHYPFRPNVQVLKGMSFVVQAGQSVGVAGPSGGGKSTIMALLQRYYDPMQGSILIGKEKLNLSDVNIRWWRHQVGFVGQEPMLFNTTVRANVLYGLADGGLISEASLESCRQMSNIDFLDKEGGSGWETEVGPRGSHLSGGQKQRVAICRALVRDPPVLLLDEATSALDSQSEWVVQEALEAARRGRTSFAIAHRLSTISNCDTIMVVSEGIIIEHGPHSDLMAKQGVYYRLQSQSLR